MVHDLNTLMWNETRDARITTTPQAAVGWAPGAQHLCGDSGALLMRSPGPLNGDQFKQLNLVRHCARHRVALVDALLLPRWQRAGLASAPTAGAPDGRLDRARQRSGQGRRVHAGVAVEVRSPQGPAAGGPGAKVVLYVGHSCFELKRRRK